MSSTSTTLDSLKALHPLLSGISDMVSVPESWEEWALGNGTAFTVFFLMSIAIAILSIKQLLVPKIGTYLRGKLDQHKENKQAYVKALKANGELLQQIVDSLKQNQDSESSWRTLVTQEFAHNRSRLDKIQDAVDAAMGDTIGRVDEKLALTEFLTCLDKSYLRCMAFFRTRCRVNGAIANENSIAEMYGRYAEVLAAKVNTQLRLYSFKGKMPISDFFANGGAESHFRHLLNEMWSLQYMQASKDTKALSITEEMIESAFEAMINRIGEDFKSWLDNQEGKSYMDLKAKNVARYTINL